jgi:hypothetical protein
LAKYLAGTRKKWKIFIAPQGQVSRLNRDLGQNCGALRAALRAMIWGHSQGFGPKIISGGHTARNGVFSSLVFVAGDFKTG